MTPTLHSPAPDNRVLIPDLHRRPEDAAGCARHELSGKAFATTWQVVFHADRAIDAIRLQSAAQAYLDRIDAQMSPYRVDSDLTRFNTASDSAYVPLPPMLLQVIRQALNIARMTDGAYDPALLEAVEAWGFGAKTVAPGVLSPVAVQGLKRRADWRSLDWAAHGLIKPAGLRLDLCGIAKGYAVDGLTQILRTTPGIRSALVEIGGELKGFGVRDDGLPYWVEIEGANQRTVIALCDLAVATSGDSRRFFIHDGQILSHTIDAATAAPTRSGVSSVTVFDAACWRADALATALMVMGEDTAMTFCAAHDIPCLMRMQAGHERLSPALEAWL
ncbi:FAD:protein FMN transferase [Asticcacaulis sp. BYS171W]|uniref:FAD:protein FMN transferase n=1 Tax=Asticcacaulis aquaticus TaxID=2984212 RepID=A0ABT5HXC1_9CAUL|nr:FAD:protein FMN transferase [Asticcacaulis aquaticus]MDC7684639.1 FAD:protein FMN transferase [Asticcacaulis aquaticus]